MNSSVQTTVRDLQNARQILQRLGHTRRDYVDHVTASVCLEGALRLATTHRLQQRLDRFGLGVDGRIWVCSFIDPQDAEAAWRFNSTVAALAEVLPDSCPEHGRMPTNQRFAIWHYNDLHCDGGEDAQRLLEQAIEKLQAQTPEGIPT